MRCKNCNRETKGDSKFCHYCGTATELSMTEQEKFTPSAHAQVAPIQNESEQCTGFESSAALTHETLDSKCVFVRTKNTRLKILIPIVIFIAAAAVCLLFVFKPWEKSLAEDIVFLFHGRQLNGLFPGWSK